MRRVAQPLSNARRFPSASHRRSALAYVRGGRCDDAIAGEGGRSPSTSPLRPVQACSSFGVRPRAAGVASLSDPCGAEAQVMLGAVLHGLGCACPSRAGVHAGLGGVRLRLKIRGLLRGLLCGLLRPCGLHGWRSQGVRLGEPLSSGAECRCPQRPVPVTCALRRSRSRQAWWSGASERLREPPPGPGWGQVPSSRRLASPAVAIAVAASCWRSSGRHCPWRVLRSGAGVCWFVQVGGWLILLPGEQVRDFYQAPGTGSLKYRLAGFDWCFWCVAVWVKRHEKIQRFTIMKTAPNKFS